MTKAVLLPFALAIGVALATAAGLTRSPAAPEELARSETPARDRWPEDYGLARGQREIWLVDNGGAHEVGARRKVGWRVVGEVERLDVKAQIPSPT